MKNLGSGESRITERELGRIWDEELTTFAHKSLGPEEEKRPHDRNNCIAVFE